MKKLIYLIVLTLILGLVLTGCLLSNVGQVPATGQKGMPLSTANLVALWHFDGDADDSTVNSNDGTVYGASWVDGKLGKALSFDGSDDYVDCGNVLQLDGVSEFTVEFWIKVDSLPFPAEWQGIIARGNTGQRTPWVFGNKGFSSLYMQFETTVVADCNLITDDLTAGQWHHVAFTWDGTTVSSYIDAVAGPTDTTVGNVLADTDGSLKFGYIPGYAYFDGIIDEVRIWDGALTADEILYSYADDTLHVDDDWAEWPGAYYTITEALAVAVDGDTINVHEGTYNETVTIQSDDSHLTLKGEEGAVIFGANAGIILEGGTHHIEISGFEITISNPVWDNPGISAWTNTWDPDYDVISYITIHHNYIHDCYKGILFGAWVWSPWGPGISHHHITIHHNEVSDNVDLGISLWGVSESNVNHNVIVDNGDNTGPTGLGNGLVFLGVSDSNANHNEIHGNDVVGLGVYDGATGNNFNNNDITENDNLGILLTGWNFPTTGNIFVRNDARNNNAWDIREFTTSGGQPAVYGNIWVKNKYDNANPDPPE